MRQLSRQVVALRRLSSTSPAGIDLTVSINVASFGIYYAHIGNHLQAFSIFSDSALLEVAARPRALESEIIGAVNSVCVDYD
jgi:hypothetical protein